MNENSIHLVWRYRDGDDRAAAVLFTRYARRLVALAQSRLSTKMARRFDAEDVVQSVYRSFFARARDGQFDLDQDGSLWRLLAAITLNKVRQKVEFHSAGKRLVDRERSRDAAAAGTIQHEVIDREPSPAEALSVLEEIEHLVAGLNPTQQRIVMLRLQDYGLEEIADEVQLCERTVRRVLDRVRARLQRRLDVGLTD